MSKFKKFVFVSLLVSGVGFAIGGVFLPPLLALSATCIGGAVAVSSSQRGEDTSEAPVRPRVPENDSPPSDSSSENLELDLHISKRHRPHGLRPSVKPFDKVDHCADNDDSATRPKPRNKF